MFCVGFWWRLYKTGLYIHDGSLLDVGSKGVIYSHYGLGSHTNSNLLNNTDFGLFYTILVALTMRSNGHNTMTNFVF